MPGSSGLFLIQDLGLYVEALPSCGELVNYMGVCLVAFPAEARGSQAWVLEGTPVVTRPGLSLHN